MDDNFGPDVGDQSYGSLGGAFDAVLLPGGLAGSLDYGSSSLMHMINAVP